MDHGGAAGGLRQRHGPQERCLGRQYRDGFFNFAGINPITALFWTAIINGLLAPPLLVVIMLISNNKAVMGTRTNSWLLNVLGWAATAIMFIAASALIVSWRAGS